MLIVSLVVTSPSLTENVIPLNTPGPCASVGVQLNVRVAASNVAPVGKPLALNVSVLAGRSASLPPITKVSRLSSFTVRFPIAFSTGAWFTSLTCT